MYLYKYQFNHWFPYFMQEMGITIFSWNFFVSERWKISYGNLGTFRSSKKLGCRNIFCLRGGGRGAYYDFPSKKFCITVPKLFVKEPFCVSETFYHKMLRMRNRGHHKSPLISFCPGIAKSWVEEPFSAADLFWYRENLRIRDGAGVSRFSFESLLTHSTGKLRTKTFLSLGKVLVSISVKDKREGGDYHDIASNFSCLTVRKHLVKKPFCAVRQKNSGVEPFFG